MYLQKKYCKTKTDFFFNIEIYFARLYIIHFGYIIYLHKNKIKNIRSKNQKKC